MSDAPDKIVIYSAKDGRPDIRLRVEDGTVWLTQAEIAELFGNTTANVHIKNILDNGDQAAEATIRESLIVQIEGNRDPARPNMALKAWSGGCVRKHDVIVAKKQLAWPWKRTESGK